ncbi:MAG TPA: chemotaxis protein CheW [Nostocaceae cyanobacterium]|nr:chemotaxis protein CheW [Nostocaceae cyanobacterium]
METKQENQQKFLSFNLGVKDTAVISLEHIIEVLQVPLTEICGVPQMPSCVLGIYSWRGEMLWLVDLEEMLGYPSPVKSSNFISKMMAVVLEHEGKYLGLLVRQLLDIEWLDIEQLKRPSAELFYPSMSPFLQGYFLNGSEQMIFNLDALAILQAPIWTMHS